MLTIGQLSERSGVATSAIRFYESRGLIESARTTGNQRRYAQATLRRVSFIRAAQRVGLVPGGDRRGARHAARPGARPPRRTGPGSAPRGGPGSTSRSGPSRSSATTSTAASAAAASASRSAGCATPTTRSPTAARARSSSTRGSRSRGNRSADGILGAWRSTSWQRDPTRRCFPCPGTPRSRSGTTSTSCRCPRGLSRHVVRIIRTGPGGTTYVAKETAGRDGAPGVPRAPRPRPPRPAGGGAAVRGHRPRDARRRAAAGDAGDPAPAVLHALPLAVLPRPRRRRSCRR